MAGFTPKEIKRQADRLRIQAKEYNTSASQLYTLYTQEESCLADSSAPALSVNGACGSVREALSRYEQSYVNIMTTLVEDFNALADIMDDWSNRSLTAEEKAAANVDTLLGKLRNIQSVVASIKKYS